MPPRKFSHAWHTFCQPFYHILDAHGVERYCSQENLHRSEERLKPRERETLLSSKLPLFFRSHVYCEEGQWDEFVPHPALSARYPDDALLQQQWITDEREKRANEREKQAKVGLKQLDGSHWNHALEHWEEGPHMDGDATGTTEYLGQLLYSIEENGGFNWSM